MPGSGTPEAVEGFESHGGLRADLREIRKEPSFAVPRAPCAAGVRKMVHRRMANGATTWTYDNNGNVTSYSRNQSGSVVSGGFAYV